jgi:hypothetical protein
MKPFYSLRHTYIYRAIYSVLVEKCNVNPNNIALHWSDANNLVVSISLVEHTLDIVLTVSLQYNETEYYYSEKPELSIILYFKNEALQFIFNRLSLPEDYEELRKIISKEIITFISVCSTLGYKLFNKNTNEELTI